MFCFLLNLVLICAVSAQEEGETKRIAYFIDGLTEVNECLETIQPMYGGGDLRVVHYRLTKDQLVECLQLLERYDQELYKYLESTCKRSYEDVPQAVAVQDPLIAGFEAFMDAQQDKSQKREEMPCMSLRSVYTMFAGLHASIYELIMICDKWIHAIDAQNEHQISPPS
jgi:hypothetical protein